MRNFFNINIAGLGQEPSGYVFVKVISSFLVNLYNKIGHRLPEFTLVDYPPMDDRCESNLRSNGRLKQEIEIAPFGENFFGRYDYAEASLGFSRW